MVNPSFETGLRLRQCAANIGRRYPDAWRLYEEARVWRLENTSKPRWPDYVFAPMGVARLAVDRSPPEEPTERVYDANRLAALAAWRTTQGIYRFDPDLSAALLTTAPHGDIPCEVLRRLPEWCVYVEAPELANESEPMHGFFAFLTTDHEGHNEELRLVFDLLDGRLRPIPLSLSYGSVEQAVNEMLDQVYRDYEAERPGIPNWTHSTPGYLEEQRKSLSALLPKLLSLLLYLCADEPEIGDGSIRPANPLPSKTRKGPRFFPPDKAMVWDVGVRMGAVLRHGAELRSAGDADEQGAGGASPRAHIRRAHWHTYLVGSGRAERQLRWIPPVLVGADGAVDLPAVIRLVQK
jgi:hypothetical protein